MSELSNTNFADAAEDVIKSLRKPNKKGEMEIALTTSKIRNILSLTNELYNQAMTSTDEKLGEKVMHDIQYVKMRVAYEYGRDKDRGQPVKEFIRKAKIMEYLSAIGDSRKNLLIFCNYMEALVAYHKFYGGKEGR